MSWGRLSWGHLPVALGGRQDSENQRSFLRPPAACREQGRVRVYRRCECCQPHPCGCRVCLADGRIHSGFRTQFATVGSCAKRSGYPNSHATSVLCVDMFPTRSQNGKPTSAWTHT